MGNVVVCASYLLAESNLADASVDRLPVRARCITSGTHSGPRKRRKALQFSKQHARGAGPLNIAKLNSICLLAKRHRTGCGSFAQVLCFVVSAAFRSGEVRRGYWQRQAMPATPATGNAHLHEDVLWVVRGQEGGVDCTLRRRICYWCNRVTPTQVKPERTPPRCSASLEQIYRALPIPVKTYGDNCVSTIPAVACGFVALRSRAQPAVA